MVAKTGVAPVRIGGDPPQAEEPAQPRVLDDQLRVLGEVPLEPLGDPDPLGLAGADPPGLEPRLRARVADLHPRLASSRSWWSTTHCGSPKPLGLVASAATSGCGTCRPMICISPARVLVPLRPAPATKSTLRG